MMETLKDYTGKILLSVIIIIFLFFGLKSCWSYPVSFSEDRMYVREELEYGGKEIIITYNPNTLLLTKINGDLWEQGFFKVRGPAATHYFGSIYGVNRSNVTFWLGFRYYPNAKTVWVAELELEDKKGNLSKSTLEEIGFRYNTTIVVFPDRIKIGSDYYNWVDEPIPDLNEAKNY